MKLSKNDRVKIKFDAGGVVSAVGSVAYVHYPNTSHRFLSYRGEKGSKKLVAISASIKYFRYDIRLDTPISQSEAGRFKSLNLDQPSKSEVRYVYVSETEIVDHFPSNITSQTTSLCLREILSHRWKDLIFRRIDEVITTKSSLKKISYLDVFGEKVLDTPQGLTKDEYKKNVSFFYSHFRGVTKPISLRANDHLEGQTIRFHSNDYCEIDMDDKMTFWFGGKDKRQEAPRYGMLVCGVVKNSKSGCYYDKWFVCSESFYKLWTIIQYEAKEVYPQKNSQSQILRKLHTNNSLWWLRCNPQSSVQQKLDRFHRIRTEATSKKYHNLYQSIALMTVYFSDESVNEVNSFKSIPNDFVNRMKDGLMWIVH